MTAVSVGPRSLSPGPGVAARAAVALLNGYKRHVSPFLPPLCRFTPTCSMYARDAILKHGFGRGAFLALRRLGRCNPFFAGGIDPVP